MNPMFDSAKYLQPEKCEICSGQFIPQRVSTTTCGTKCARAKRKATVSNKGAGNSPTPT